MFTANLPDSLARHANGLADFLQPRPERTRFGDGGVALAATRNLREHAGDALPLPVRLGLPRMRTRPHDRGAHHGCALSRRPPFAGLMRIKAIAVPARRAFNPAGKATGPGVMAIYRIFEKSAFEPEDVRRMSEAYEDALLRLELKDRNDPLTEIVARLIIEIAQTGEKDPARICTLALARLDER